EGGGGVGGRAEGRGGDRGDDERAGRHALRRGRAVLVARAVHRADAARPGGDGEGVPTARQGNAPPRRRERSAVVVLTIGNRRAELPQKSGTGLPSARWASSRSVAGGVPF